MLDPQERLRKAVIDGNLPIVQRLLSRFPSLWLNVDPEHQGWSNLHYASYYGHYLICFHLISFIGNDLETKYTKLDLLSFDNLTVLHVCIKGGNIQTLHYLLQEFPGKLWLNYAGGDDKQTPLHWSCKYGFSEVTKLLLEFGAKWDERDGNGDICLHHCFQHGNLECIQEILRYIFQNSPDKEKAMQKINYYEHMRNNRGCVAFDYASSSNMARKYQLLKQEIMSIDFTDSSNESSNSSMVYTLQQNPSMHSMLTSPILPMSIQKEEEDYDNEDDTMIHETNSEVKPARRAHSQSLPANPSPDNASTPLSANKVRIRSNTNYIYHPPSLITNIPILTSPRLTSPPMFSPTTPGTNRAPSLKSVTISPSVRSSVGHDSTDDHQRPTSPQSVWSIQSSINTSPTSRHAPHRSFSFSKMVQTSDSIDEHDQWPTIQNDVSSLHDIRLSEGTTLRPRAESASVLAASASASYLAAKKAFASSRVGGSSEAANQAYSPRPQKSNSLTSNVSIGSIGSPVRNNGNNHVLRKSQSIATMTNSVATSVATSVPTIHIPQRSDSSGSLASPTTPLETSSKFSFWQQHQVMTTQATISSFFKTTTPISVKSEKSSSSSTNSSPKSHVLDKFSFSNGKEKQSSSPDPQPPTPTASPLQDKALVEAVPRKRKTTSRPAAKSKASTYTPLEKQIIDLTDEHPDKILLIQVGYKYKVYGPHAEIVSRILNIMYITKDNPRFSYCSFPDLKLHINIQRIISHGHKIGVVKQQESAIVRTIEKKGSDLMKREVTGVYTKGTYLSDEFVGNGSDVENHKPRYIICICEFSDQELAVVAVQLLTGDIFYDSFKDALTREELETRLTYLCPSEVIVVNSRDEISPNTLKILKVIDPELVPMHRNIEDNQLENIAEHLTADLIEYYSINFPRSIQTCIATLVRYLAEFKLNSVFTLRENLTAFTDTSSYMILPASTLNALDIFTNSTDPECERGTLLWILNHTRTRMGRRMFTKWVSRPLIHRQTIEDRLQAIEDLGKGYIHVVDSLRNQLDKLKKLDLEELLIKTHYSVSYNTGKLSRRDVFRMIHGFNDIFKVVGQFEKSITELNKSVNSRLLLEIFEGLLNFSKVNVVGEFVSMINPSYLLNESKDMDERKIQFFNLDNFRCESIIKQQDEIARIESLLNDELINVRQLLKRPQLKYITNNREPYLIEVRNGKAVDELPETFQRINGTTTVSRFRTQEISRLYKLLQYHQEILLQSCDEAYVDFLKQIDDNYAFFRKTIHHLSTFDCILSLTAASLIPNHVRPNFTDELSMDVRQGRNPIIEQLRENYVPNDISISYDKNRTLIITGPNMGGKSSYVKQIALLVIMSQVGAYIPCKSATMGIFDAIFMRMGAKDDILRGQSTFMTEMNECGAIISGLTNRSLVIMDEIGRGTGTTDGIAIAYSVLKYLVECDAKPLVCFITHYPSLHVLEEEFPSQVVNYHMGFKEVVKEGEFPEVVFLYNLVRGVIGNSYGLNVAKLAGVPNDIIRGAYMVSETLRNKIEARDQYRFYKKMIEAIISGDDLLQYLSAIE
ncbi:DNA mismatch repair protein MSH3 [Spathaspora sp. JA1]|nr:DNA mismatch repair protein MSH3 [Spathaspora sp. JA1]